MTTIKHRNTALHKRLEETRDLELRHVTSVLSIKTVKQEVLIDLARNRLMPIELEEDNSKLMTAETKRIQAAMKQFLSATCDIPEKNLKNIARPDYRESAISICLI